jgi:ribonuclease Z
MAIDNELIILGNSSASPTVDRHHTAQYFQFGADRILIDCGEGTQKRLLEEGVAYNKIDHIFISHLHGDHYLGLVGLLNTMGLNGRKKDINIYAPKELKAILDAHFTVSGHYLNFPIHMHPHKDGAYTVTLKQLTVTCFPMVHRLPCHGFSFKELQNELPLNIEACQTLDLPIHLYKDIKKGENIDWNGETIANKTLTLPQGKPLSYAYMSDTRYTPLLADYVTEATLLYHETTFLHNLVDRAEMTAHSTAYEAGLFANQSAVYQLIIGHFSSRYTDLNEFLEEARKAFKQTELALEGARFTLG